jgi:2-C-methyl-D-erythritol 2,4-cyclodiphosphate synthase
MSDRSIVYRIGHGYDLHRLEPPPPAGAGRPFVLGGIEIPHDRGPVGHSDGDALLHAITDALLGALGEPDIGELFPDSDPAWDGTRSDRFLLEALQRLRGRGGSIENLDCTVICERPKLRDHKKAMRAALAQLLEIEESRVNVKGKTHEKVDAVGEGRAIEVHVVVLVRVGG